MNSPPKEPVRSNSELDYAPPWMRDRARDRTRPAFEEIPGLPAQEQSPGNLLSDSRLSLDDRTWHQRALDPELVPEPPAGTVSLWPTMLRMGIVCALAAFVAAAVVLLFNPKQNAHKVAAADGTPPIANSDDAPPQSAATARIVPALTAESSALASTPPPQQMPERQVSDTNPPPQAISPNPPAPQPSANVDVPAPAVSQPAPQPSEPVSPASNTSRKAQVASLDASQPPASGAKQSQSLPTKPITLDPDEISALITRGNNFLKVGDFSAARVLFERAADAGSAEAALALGSTYDPLTLKRLGAVAVKPDIERARKWYQIAADRGSSAATLQLANLPPVR
jgi:hypothetical protein